MKINHIISIRLLLVIINYGKLISAEIQLRQRAKWKEKTSEIKYAVYISCYGYNLYLVKSDIIVANWHSINSWEQFPVQNKNQIPTFLSFFCFNKFYQQQTTNGFFLFLSKTTAFN